MGLSSDRIQDALYGFARSQLLFTACDLDIFTQIANGHRVAPAIAKAIHVDLRALTIVLDGLVGIGFLEKHNSAYKLPPDVEKYLVKTSPSYMGGMVKHGKRLMDTWTQLSSVVKTGQPAGSAQGLAQLEAYFAELAKGLYVSNYPTAQQLAEMLDFKSAPNDLSILDVGGGTGVWSIALLEANHNARATILDYPSVVEIAKEYVAKHQLSERVTYTPGDLEMLTLPENTYDFAVLANICHAIGPFSTAELIAHVAEALKPGGKLVVVDFVPDDDRSEPGWPLLFGVNEMITTDEGNVFTQTEYTQWFEAAGLSLASKHILDGDVTALVASKS